MNFDDWFNELKRLAVAEFGFAPEAAETLDAEAYRDTFFKSGMTPKEAMFEDMSYGDVF